MPDGRREQDRYTFKRLAHSPELGSVDFPPVREFHYQGDEDVIRTQRSHYLGIHPADHMIDTRISHAAGATRVTSEVRDQLLGHVGHSCPSPFGIRVITQKLRDDYANFVALLGGLR